MMTKIENSQKSTKKRGGFGVDILYPGIIQPNHSDTGLGTIGRIDDSQVKPGTLIPMHPHRDDEILTYIRGGNVKHTDSEGHSEVISSQRLMLMNAGSEFQHEEQVMEEGETLQALQIFIRPEQGDMKPQVQFHRFNETTSINQWRRIAGKDDNFPLTFRSDTWLYDIRLERGTTQHLSKLPNEQASLLLYVFEGEIIVNDNLMLETGESLFIERENPEFKALEDSDIVLFVTDTESSYFKGGMYSGNQAENAMKI